MRPSPVLLIPDLESKAREVEIDLLGTSRTRSGKLDGLRVLVRNEEHDVLIIVECDGTLRPADELRDDRHPICDRGISLKGEIITVLLRTDAREIGPPGHILESTRNDIVGDRHISLDIAHQLAEYRGPPVLGLHGETD